MLTPRGTGAHKPVRRGARRTPVGSLLLVVALTVALAGTAWWVSHRDPGDDVAAAARPACPTPSPPPTAVPATAVKVNVYNATEKRGLAAEVAAQLRKRGFRVKKVDNDPLDRAVTGAAEVRHSTTGADAARTVTAQVAPDGQVGAAAAVVSVPDQRPDASVDLVLGAAFRGLRPPADAAAALRPTPQPMPSGCRSQPVASR
jgi:hypothetical protein